jgi:predicted P-loop ATPase
MLTEKGGGFIGNIFNVVLVLRHDLRLRGTIGLNVRGQVPWCLRDSPAGPAGAWTDDHTTALTAWLQHEGFPVGPEIVDRALGVVGRESPTNPVADWLKALALAWDGEKRIERWLVTYLGAADTKLNRALGPMILIGAAARGIDLGVQCDCIPILEGPQGGLKSSAVRVLGGPFCGEDLPNDLRSKDCSLVVGKYWIIEISELTALIKAHVAELNSFITRRKYSYRPPYARYVIEQPRGAFLIGTCNPPTIGYLKDPSGGRRFLPVEVGAIDLQKLRADVGQLWGEATMAYLNGARWWPSPEILEELNEVQADRFEGDSWEGTILATVEQLDDPFSIETLILRAFPAIEKHQIDRSMESRVGRILSTRQPPLKRDRQMIGGTRVRFYIKPKSKGSGPKTKAQE